MLDHLKLNSASISGKCYNAFNYFLHTGSAALKHYPYTGRPAEPLDVALPYRAVAWGYVSDDDQAPSVKQIKKALLRYGPLAAGIISTPKLKAYSGGVFNEPDPPNPNHVRTNHAMVIVGWDDSRGGHGAWKIKGTWGADWGEQGYLWIAYGSNNVACDATWVRAASTYYDLPADAFAKLVPSAKPLPAAHFAERAKESNETIAAAR